MNKYQEALDLLSNTIKDNLISFDDTEKKAVETLQELVDKVNEWILFKKREATKEEKEMYEWDYVLDCEIPNDGQEILVSDGEVVWSDVFINFGDCYGLESNTELTGLAWMPLPEPYKRSDEE